MKFCAKHANKPLDYYCAECKKIVCASCFVENHKLHDCKDVAKVDQEFRKTIKKEPRKMSTYEDEMLSMKRNREKIKADYLKKIVEKENKIHKRSQELKRIIEKHTKLLLDELSLLNQYT